MPRAPQMPPASQQPQMAGPVLRMPPAMAPRMPEPRMPEPRPQTVPVPRSELRAVRPAGRGDESGGLAQVAAAGNSDINDSFYMPGASYFPLEQNWYHRNMQQ